MTPRSTLPFPCDGCREVPAGIDEQGRRLCADCRQVGDRHCPALDARCPWPADCARCQIDSAAN